MTCFQDWRFQKIVDRDWQVRTLIEERLVEAVASSDGDRVSVLVETTQELIICPVRARHAGRYC